MARSKNPKMTLAKKMLTSEERKHKRFFSPFHSEAWTKRFMARQNKLINK